MTDAGKRLAVAVDLDPSVWLAGPTDGGPSAWTTAALDAVSADFGVADGSPEHDLLREVLDAFAHADLGCDFRFLRLRSPAETPVVAMLHIWTADGAAAGSADDGDAVLTTYQASTRWYDAEPEVVVLDQQSGLRRSVRYAVDDERRLTSVVRHHRHVPELATDVVLSCAGADLRTTALALADLDDLAQAVRLVDAGGRRW